jgi:hypothetical protein
MLSDHVILFTTPSEHIEPVPLEPINPHSLITGGITVTDNTCSICYSEMSEPNPNTPDDGTYTLPECTHRFHTACIVPWFRTDNTCPYCRSCPENKSIYRSNHGEYTFNRRFSTRKDAPKQLKTLVNKLKQKEAIARRATSVHRAWFKSEDGITFKNLHKIERAMMNKVRSSRGYKIRQLKSEIAAYPIIKVPVRVRSVRTPK